MPLPVCRLCNARLDTALSISIGRRVKVVCPNCKAEEVYDDYLTPKEQKAKYNKIIKRIKDGYY